MFPEIADLEFNTEQTEKETANVGTSFLFDFEAGDFLVKDGRVQTCTGTEALRVWIQKIIRTEKFKFEVYAKESGDEYGITIQDLIVGYDLPQEFIEAELQREISEALTRHPSIQSISNFSITKDNPKITITFTVNLVDGTVTSEEVTL